MRTVTVSLSHFEAMKKKEIEALLEQLNLKLHYLQVFDRWVLNLKDADGCTVWHRRGIDAVELRDELVEFLEARTTAKPQDTVTKKKG